MSQPQLLHAPKHHTSVVWLCYLFQVNMEAIRPGVHCKALSWERQFFEHLRECCHRFQHFCSSGMVVIPWTILKMAVLEIEPRHVHERQVFFHCATLVLWGRVSLCHSDYVAQAASSPSSPCFFYISSTLSWNFVVIGVFCCYCFYYFLFIFYSSQRRNQWVW